MVQDESNPGPPIKEHTWRKEAKPRTQTPTVQSRNNNTKNDGYWRWEDRGQGTGITKPFQVARAKAVRQVILRPEAEGP